MRKSCNTLQKSWGACPSMLPKNFRRSWQIAGLRPSFLVRVPHGFSCSRRVGDLSNRIHVRDGHSNVSLRRCCGDPPTQHLCSKGANSSELEAHLELDLHPHGYIPGAFHSDRQTTATGTRTRVARERAGLPLQAWWLVFKF